MGICLCLGSQPGGEGVRSHPGEPGAGAAGHHKAAGFQLVPGTFYNGIFFTGDQGFIHLKFPGKYNAVGADLVSGEKFHHVIAHQQIGANGCDFPVPEGANLLGGHQRQLIHRPFCPDFLVAADDGIANDHNQKGHIFYGRAAESQNHCQHHKYQVEKGQAVF